MKQSSILILMVFIFVFYSCNKKSKEPNYSEIPKIEFTSMSHSKIKIGVDEGKWALNFNFVDGDGDLGTDETFSKKNVFLRNEVTLAEYEFPFPFIPEFARRGKKYIQGSSSVVLEIPIFMKPRLEPAGRDKDTFHFSLFIVDDAGHHSDTIYTPPVYISK
ncbi:MAG TPA: hypothetical protein VLZ83_14470 [Edaphocola sp.]|nr:hypothetical protein [Edaphocola sp.]